MSKKEIVAKAITENQTLGNTDIARLLFREYPSLFKTVDAARHHVRDAINNKPNLKTTGSPVNIQSLTADEIDLIKRFRDSKTQLEHECSSAGIDISDVKHYWYKSEMFSIFAKPHEKTLQDLKDEMIKGLSKYSPSFKTFKREKVKEGHCLVIDPADIHIGKLASAYETGNDYNVNIAVQRVKEGINGILQNVSHYPIDQIVLIIGNDILHTDNSRRTTTAGTAQDTDGQWYDNFRVAQSLYVDIIDQLLPIAKVHVMHNVSNHDYMTGWFLAQITDVWYRNCKDITFDSDMKHRKAYRYHDNLIGSTHGDGAKNGDLPLLFAHEHPDIWSKTKHKYIYTHHVHHKTSKDYIGVTVESSRSASGTDSWHHRNGFTGAPKAIEAYLHHKTRGQSARFSYVF